MRAFMKFFDTEVDKYLSTDFFIESRIMPDKLLKELKSEKQQKKLIKVITTSTPNPFRLMKQLALLNLLLVYSNNFYELIQQHLTLRLSNDNWLNEKFIIPYYKFLVKCCTSRQTYMICKNSTFNKCDPYEMLFYTTNMLKFLFKVVEKMPHLGRYYKSKNEGVVSGTIEIIAVQAQKLYNGFKQSLTDILSNSEVYIKEKDEQSIKAILAEELSQINEQMKKLFLDKYFYPLGKGIGVKLFKPEDQSKEVSKIIQGIVSNHEETERRKEKQELEMGLFPASGLVDWKFYEETLLGGPMGSMTMDIKENGVTDLDDIVLSEEEEQKQKVEAIDIRKKKKEEEVLQKGKTESQKQTNSGTQQINKLIM